MAGVDRSHSLNLNCSVVVSLLKNSHEKSKGARGGICGPIENSTIQISEKSFKNFNISSKMFCFFVVCFQRWLEYFQLFMWAKWAFNIYWVCFLQEINHGGQLFGCKYTLSLVPELVCRDTLSISNVVCRQPWLFQNFVLSYLRFFSFKVSSILSRVYAALLPELSL